MGHPNASFTLGIPFASSDGKFYSRFPQGNAFSVPGDASAAFPVARTVSAPTATASASAPSEIIVSNLSQLMTAIATANANGGVTITLNPFTYQVAADVAITGNNITIRGATGNRSDVTIRGDAMSPNAAVGVVLRVSGTGFKLQDLSIGICHFHAVQCAGEDGCQTPTFNNVRFFDTYQQMLKCTIVGSTTQSVNNGIVTNCLFEYTTAPLNYYIGGIDGHACKGWTVSGNTFRYIRAPAVGVDPVQSAAEHAIHFWDGAQNNLVEKNTIIDCDRGIGFGLGALAVSIGGTVRNNMIYHSANGDPWADVSVGIENCTGAEVYNNTILQLHNRLNWAIEYRFNTTGTKIQNNLTNLQILSRDGGTLAANTNNVTNAQASWFVNPSIGDLHLASDVLGVKDAGASIPSVTDDFDGQTRPQGSAYDVGADERVAQPLLQASNITYLGRFRLDVGGANGGFDSGGASLAVSGSTLYMAGNNQGFSLGRINIPASLAGAPITTVVQQPVATPGTSGTNGNKQYQTGCMVYNGRVYLQKATSYDTGFPAYDLNVFQSAALNLTGFTAMQQGSYSGGGLHRFYNGYMTEIPAEWKGPFGGPCLAGNCQMSNNASASAGSALGVFDPAQITGSGLVTVTPVIHHPWSDTANWVGNMNVANDLLARADQFMAGIVFPSGYRTVMMVGRHGYGAPHYKEPGDPCDSIMAGEEAYPYRLQGWLYDCNDLLAAKNGQRAYQSCRPYAWINLSAMAPGFDSCANTLMGGCTYDHATRRFYVTTPANWPNLFDIHVWQVA